MLMVKIGLRLCSDLSEEVASYEKEEVRWVNNSRMEFEGGRRDVNLIMAVKTCGERARNVSLLYCCCLFSLFGYLVGTHERRKINQKGNVLLVEH